MSFTYVQIFDQGILISEELLEDCDVRPVQFWYEEQGYEVRSEAA